MLCSSPYLVNESSLFGLETKEPNLGICAVGTTTQLNVCPKYAERNLPSCFTNSFGTLDHFKVDCKAEELPQGQHLVILTMDTSFEKASNLLRASHFVHIRSKTPLSSLIAEPGEQQNILIELRGTATGKIFHPSVTDPVASFFSQGKFNIFHGGIGFFTRGMFENLLSLKREKSQLSDFRDFHCILSQLTEIFNYRNLSFNSR